MPEHNAQPTPYTCPECGAIILDGATCEEIFNALLALEFRDPVAGSVHHLTVTCFMLQHDRYSDAAVPGMLDLLAATLERGVTPQAYRTAHRAEVDSGRRTFKILRPADAPPRPPIAWPVTIADARAAPAAEPDRDPAGHPARVERWARAVLATIRALGGYPPIPPA